MINKIIYLLMLSFLTNACSKDSTSSMSTTTPVATVNNTVPDVYKKIYGASSITSDGTYITIKSNGAPDHKSSYYATSNTLYDNFSGLTFGGYNFAKNPNSIGVKSYVFKIPVNPLTII